MDFYMVVLKQKKRGDDVFTISLKPFLWEVFRLIAPSIKGDAGASGKENTNFVIQNNTPRVEIILNIRHTASNTNPTVLSFKNCVNTFSKIILRKFQILT